MRSICRSFLFLLLLAVFSSCTSEIGVEVYGENQNASLHLAKTSPINTQLVEELNLEVGETIKLYSLLDRSSGSYKNIPVRWSLVGNVGSLTVILSGKEATFNPLLVGSGYIEVEDSGLTKRVSLKIGPSISPPIANDLNPSNGIEDLEKIITLDYTDKNNDKATACSISGLNNIQEITTCSCDVAGVCSVGVRGSLGYSGTANFNYTVTAGGDLSNIASVTFNIDDVVSICPTGFIEVEGNGTLGTMDFCVMKYEARDDGSGNAISHAAGIPWININADDSQAECEAMSEGGFSGVFTLISNPEWMTIARNIENVNSNWSSGTVGTGNLARGWSARLADDGFGNTTFASTTDLNNLYNSAANTGALSGIHKLRRTNLLSNGFEIWDFSGNVYEWVDWDPVVAGFTLGLNDGDSFGWNELNDLVGSKTQDDIGPLGPYTSTHQAGRWYPWISAFNGVMRGGSWDRGTNAGIYNLGTNFATTPRNYIGFRCVYRP